MAVGGCLKVTYTGASASCLLVCDATGKTLTAKIGAAGAEAPDAAFGAAGVLDLALAANDTLTELAAVIDAYTNYSAVIHFGDDIPTSNIVSTTVQAKTIAGYVFFDQTSVLSTYALTTWARAKQLLGLADSLQTVAEYMINAATNEAERIAGGRRIKARTYSATSTIKPYDFNGNGRTRFMLPDYPINSVSKIYIDSERAFGATTEVDSDDYVIHEEEGIVEMDGWTFSAGLKNVRIERNSGISIIDDEVQNAVIEVLSWNSKRFSGSGIGIRSITSPDGVNTSMELDIPMHARRVFEGLRDGRL